MDCSMPGLPVHHQCPELTQTHVHWVSHDINHLIIVPFSFCLQSFPASGSFQMSQLFASGGQSVGVSASSVLPMNTQDWSPLGWTGWISLGPRDSQESSPTLQFKNISSSVLSFFYSPTHTSIPDYWKNHSFDQIDLCWKVMFLLFNMLSRLVITFLPRSKCLNFMAAITICSDFGAQKDKSITSE